MIATKAREPGLAFPQDHPIEGVPQPVAELTAEQRSLLAEAESRDYQRQREWASIVQALEDNSMAVFRAMRRFRSEGEHLGAVDTSATTTANTRIEISS